MQREQHSTYIVRRCARIPERERGLVRDLALERRDGLPLPLDERKLLLDVDPVRLPVLLVAFFGRPDEGTVNDAGEEEEPGGV